MFKWRCLHLPPFVHSDSPVVFPLKVNVFVCHRLWATHCRKIQLKKGLYFFIHSHGTTLWFGIKFSVGQSIAEDMVFQKSTVCVVSLCLALLPILCEPFVHYISQPFLLRQIRHSHNLTLIHDLMNQCSWIVNKYSAVQHQDKCTINRNDGLLCCRWFLQSRLQLPAMWPPEATMWQLLPMCHCSKLLWEVLPVQLRVWV